MGCTARTAGSGSMVSNVELTGAARHEKEQE